MSEGKKEILLGDCLELMKDIPNGSIDMILCDLPYGTTQLGWDCLLDMFELWNEYHRVIKDNGPIVLTASQPFTSKLVMSNIENFKYEWIWDKKMCSGFMAAKYRPLLAHENILVFAKNKTIYNPLFTERTETELKRFSHKFKEIESKTEHASHLTLSNKSRDDAKMKNPSTLIRINGLVNSSKEKKQGLHPTQKPTELFEYLIKTYTNENDLVLDNCAGSGTTAIACLNTNRQFIVMEKEQKYYDNILKRVGDFNKNFEPQTLFGNEM